MSITYFISRAVLRVLFRGVCGVKVSGVEHIPASGGFILASNHISYYDPPLIGSVHNRVVSYLAKKELFSFPPAGAFLRSVYSLPVKRGVVDREALKMCAQAIEGGHGLVVFPEGTRSKTDQFLKPKPGIGMIAQMAGCAIVPGFIYGSNHLKDCILRRTRMTVTFGPPIPDQWVRQTERGRAGYFQIADEVMNRIGLLRDEHPALKK